MQYKAVKFSKDKKDNRYLIVNDGGPFFETNLRDNEIIIEQLFSKHCPLNQNCIDYIKENGFSRFCRHFVCFAQITPHQFSFDSFFCSIDRSYRLVSELKPLNCSIGRKRCVQSKHLKDVVITPYPHKSNCHVICGPPKQK